MPSQLTADDFLTLHLQYKSTRAEGELPAVIEHDFADGRMSDHYFTTPGPALLQDEAVKEWEQIENILFLQQPGGAPWQVLLHEPAMVREISFDMPEEEFRKLLQKFGVVLPGEPGFVMP